MDYQELLKTDTSVLLQKLKEFAILDSQNPEKKYTKDIQEIEEEIERRTNHGRIDESRLPGTDKGDLL